jgi:hypothetical protein
MITSEIIPIVAYYLLIIDVSDSTLMVVVGFAKEDGEILY